MELVLAELLSTHIFESPGSQRSSHSVPACLKQECKPELLILFLPSDVSNERSGVSPEQPWSRSCRASCKAQHILHCSSVQGPA